MTDSKFQFRPQFQDILLTVSFSVLEKSEEYLVKNGCKVSYTEEDEDNDIAWIAIDSMPHKFALFHCKKFNVSTVEYYLFKLNDSGIREKFLNDSDDEFIYSLWEGVDECHDGDNAAWENAIKATAYYLNNIQYEFK